MKNIFKNIFLIILIVFSVSSTGMSQTPDFTGLKVMINPGHGGHDPDDRGQPNGYWESEGNLTKGLWLRDILEARGCEVVMSRVQNRTQDDLPLSQIAEMANTNHVDLFISIHSNAGNQMSNYPMPIFNGKSEKPSIPEAKEWAKILWEQLITNDATFWTSTAPHYIGDLTLNPSWSYGYGVLYPLNVPGIISEGSFHDYKPEQDRLLNIEYRKQEAWNIYYAMVTYFKLEGKEEFGQITGIVRDSLLVKETYTIPDSPDKYEVVNNATVEILETGEKYIVDSVNSGFYYFDSIPAGNYNVVFSAKNYFTDTVKLTVNPHEFTYWNHWFKADKTMAPKLLSTTPLDGDTIKCFDAIKFKFNMNMDSATFTEAFSITPKIDGNFIWDKDYLNVLFQPEVPYQTNTKYAIYVDSTAEHQWGVRLNSAINFSFITDNRNKFLVEKSFPVNEQAEISPYLQFRIIFDAPIKNSSLIGAISIIKDDGKIVGTKGALITVVDNKGHYYFEPVEELEYDSNYTLQLLGSIQGSDNIPLVDTVKIKFSTHSDIGELNILEEFESLSRWSINFEQSSELDESSFLYSWRRKKLSGEASMLVRYNFLNESGSCVIQPTMQIDINSSYKKIGMWVWGEMSNNEIYYTFDNNVEQLLTVIDFAGWKYCSLNVPEGAIKLTGIKLIQTETGATGGDIYFDALSQIEPISMAYDNSKLSIKVFPNPILNNVINISGLENKNASYSIYTINSQLIQKGKLYNHAGEAKIILNKLGTKQNILFLTILGEKSNSTFKLLNGK